MLTVLFKSPRMYVLSLIIVLSSCSSSVSYYGEDVDYESLSEESLMERMREAWYCLADKSQKKKWSQATITYNNSLRALINKGRVDHDAGQLMRLLSTHEHSKIYPFSTGNTLGSFYVEFDFPQSDIYHYALGDRFCDVLPSEQVDLSILPERVTVPGLGVPVVAWVDHKDAERVNQYEVLKDIGVMRTMTAYVSFPPKNKKEKRGAQPEKPRLYMLSRLNNETITTDKNTFTLAGDFSAPIDVTWEMSKVKKNKFLGFFRPKDDLPYEGLILDEPFNEKKIPVIFTHGLMSSPETYASLINRLRANEDIRKNYQFWFFGYPTGINWALSAKDQRDAIKAVLDRHDPKRKNPRMKNMVFVGHSMGGLITRLNTAKEGWKILMSVVKPEKQKYLAPDKIEQYLKPDERKIIMDKFYFKSPGLAKRAIYLATPHKGAPFADSWISRMGSYLIKVPDWLVEETYKTLTFQRDMFLINPEKALKGMTSVRQLSPQSTNIRGLQYLESTVPVHTVLGDRGKGDTPDSSDGVVPYYSSHLDWSKSEKIVPTNHSVQESEECYHEVLRILREHLSHS